MKFESVPQLVEFIRDNKNKRFNVIYENGNNLEKARLFVSSTGIPAYFSKRSRTNGFALELAGLLEIEVVKTMKDNLSDEEVFKKNAKKLVAILKQSGLWQNIVDQLENEYEYSYDKMKAKEFDFAYSILKWNVKKMNFRPNVGRYDRELATEINERKLSYIKDCIESRKECSVNASNSYDVRFNYNPELQKAWYSEEYKGCANGHYYLAIDSSHAIYYEKD